MHEFLKLLIGIYLVYTTIFFFLFFLFFLFISIYLSILLFEPSLKVLKMFLFSINIVVLICCSGGNIESSGEPAVASSSGVETAASNSEIPEGVDPSFLAALPDEMREEVIAEQLRYIFLIVTFQIVNFLSQIKF